MENEVEANQPEQVVWPAEWILCGSFWDVFKIYGCFFGGLIDSLWIYCGCFVHGIM